MRSSALLFTILSSLSFAACSDKGEDTNTGGDDTVDTNVYFSVSGTAKSLLNPSATVEGLNISIADPTAALGGGELEVLATSTVGAGGAYELTDVTTSSGVGLLVLIEDDAGTVMPTATGVKKDEYNTLANGDAITDFTAYSIDGTSQAGLQAGLAAAGYAGDLGTDGALVGFVLDSAGAPIADAVVSGASSSTVYYANADGTFNTTGTVAATNALFIIPAAPIYTYTCAATGVSFESVLGGSQPGYAVLVRFVAG